MIAFLLLLLTVLCLAIVAWGLLQRDRIIQFPFLATLVVLGYMVPQLVGLTNNTTLPNGGLEKALIMVILCLAAAWGGYTFNRRPAKLFRWHFNRKRLLWSSVLLSLFGAFFFYQINLIAVDVTAKTSGQWSGIITIYAFFSMFLTYGMVIALIMHLNRPSVPTTLIIMFDLIFYLDRIIIQGRRAAMVELGLMFIMAFWFQRRWLIPRWTMAAIFIAGALLINSIGDYRSTMMREDRWNWSGASINEIMAIDFLGNIKRITNGKSGNYELMNTIMNIEAVEKEQNFDVGLSLWNYLIHSYVPGQLLGYDFKKYLKIDIGENIAYEEFGYKSTRGSTMTGFSDAFMSFWYFGAIKFLIIGIIMSRWYKAAMQGNTVAQIIMILVISPSLHAFTHMTHLFFAIFIQLAIFLLPFLMFSRVNRLAVPQFESETQQVHRITPTH